MLPLIAVTGSAGMWADWEWLNPRPQGRMLCGLASSDSLVVAVGDGGIILVSANGVNWEIVHSQTGAYLLDVTWTGDQFVAVGGQYYWGKTSHPPAPSYGIILTSPDGREWTVCHESGLRYFTKVIYNVDQILAIGVKGLTATSPDGLTWSEHVIEEPTESGMFDVAWNGSVYAAIGGIDFGMESMITIYHSEDGATWTEAQIDDPPTYQFDSIVWDHGRFLAYAGWTALSSPDGVLWTEETRNLGVGIDEVIATPDEYLAVGGGHFLRSSDGLSWTSADVFPQPKSLYDLVVFEGKLLIVGPDGAITVSTDGGQHWDAVTTWEFGIDGSGDIDDLCWANGIMIAVSDGGRIFRSLDGLEWQHVTSFYYGVSSVRWIDNAFWLVGPNKLIAVSSDGITWTLRSYESGATYADIAANGEVMVVGGRRTGGSAVFATSSDGFAWDETEVDGNDGLIVLSVTWTGTRFVGISSSDLVFTSFDGLQWESEFLDVDWPLNSVASNGSTLVAVGSRDVIVSDDDGLTWQPSSSLDSASDVIWTGEMFLAGRGGIHSSRNGHDWITSPVGLGGGATHIASEGREIVFSGAGENLMRSRLINYLPPREFDQEFELD